MAENLAFDVKAKAMLFPIFGGVVKAPVSVEFREWAGLKEFPYRGYF